MKRQTGWSFAAPPDVDVSPVRRSKLSGQPPEPEQLPARMPAQPPLQVDFSQAEARTQRRNGLGFIHYTAFDVAAEVEAQCRPLAAEVAVLTAGPGLLRDRRDTSIFMGGPVVVDPLRDVVAIAEAVHGLRVAVTSLLAAHGSAEARSRLAVVVRDPAHTAAPGVDLAGLQSGSWVDACVVHVQPLAADLAAVVAGSPAGQVSVLDRKISDVVRGFDLAVRDLERRLPELHGRLQNLVDARVWQAGEVARRERDRVDSELRKLGVSS